MGVLPRKICAIIIHWMISTEQRTVSSIQSFGTINYTYV